MDSKVTPARLLAMKRAGQRCTLVTVFDHHFAGVLDRCGVDQLLVGDSVARLVLGRQQESSVSVDEMILFARAVAGAGRRAMVVVDVPQQALRCSRRDIIEQVRRLVREGGADAVKVDGGAGMADTIAALAADGIPIMASIGQLDEGAKRAGELRGLTPEDRSTLRTEALDAQEAGAFMVGLVLVATDAAREITRILDIPTNGIGSGPFCDGQSTLLHALLGLMPGQCPPFLKCHADVTAIAAAAVGSFIEETRAGRLPGPECTPG